MLLPFFALAAVSPSRQRAFRSLLIIHLLLLLGGVALLKGIRPSGLPLFGQVLLITGIVEGSLLIGWRMTQLPKSLAVEFLLVSPLRPWQIFIAELLIGVTRLAFITLSSLPVLALLTCEGELQFFDLAPLVLLPFISGCVSGLSLIVWAYEPATVRRWGQRVVLVLIVFYLLVGVLAGEHLRTWLGFLPDGARSWFMSAFEAIHLYSPFAVMQFAFQENVGEAAERVWTVLLIGLVVGTPLAARSAWRFRGHFHERHYFPVADVRGKARPDIGETPLRWWAIKRVSEYSGWVNLWLAGGFGLLYAVYVVAEHSWPSWLGKVVFEMVDNAGGVPILTTALVVLAAVPAAFQYGLWDSNAHERLKKMELLLLTGLDAFDYWQAACAAAWKRGQGYFLIAGVLWLAAAISGRMGIYQVMAAVAAGATLWGLYFALGFRAFSRGQQASGLGLLLTIGLPLMAYALYQVGLPLIAGLTPPGAVYRATGHSTNLGWVIGPLLAGWLALRLARESRERCDAELRAWYDRNHGARLLD